VKRPDRNAVIILALESDLHADSVAYQLVQTGARVIRIDPTVDRSLPKEVTILHDPGRGICAAIELPKKGRLTVDEIAGILCRFAIEKLVPFEGDSPLEQFARGEELAAFLGFLRLVSPQRWINDPWAEARADCKILQAQAAHAVGLRVPAFAISSQYSALAAFAAGRTGGAVIKPLSDTPLAKTSAGFVDIAGLATHSFHAPYATDFSSLADEEAQNVDLTPSLVQARIDKSFDIRATVVDAEIFSAAMPTLPDSPVDFRRSASIEAQPFDLPDRVKQQLVKLVAGLGLRFASCDLVADRQGEIHFLESNVSGNWLWTERDAGLPVSQALAKALVRGGRSMDKPSDPNLVNHVQGCGNDVLGIDGLELLASGLREAR
jgi:glutathione synthase/RimK-type ligase-like ATP-grasp enzyme